MGASDAINALRSDAAAKTALNNTISEAVGLINGEAQKQAGTVRQARDNAVQQLVTQNGQMDASWSKMRQNLRGLNESGIGLVFGIINLIVNQSGGSAISAAADLISMLIDIRIMAEEINVRDRHWDSAQVAGTFVSMYSPAMPTLAR